MRPRQRRDRPAAGGVKVVHLEAFLPSQGGVGIYSVELYLQVRLACADGMSQRAAAKRFNVSRETVRKMLSFSSPPGYRRQSVPQRPKRSEEHTSELQSLMRISYAVFCLKKKTKANTQ